MRRRFRVEQIVCILMRTEVGLLVAEVVGKAGVNDKTLCRREKWCLQMESDDV
jgi:hypothetical protein